MTCCWNCGAEISPPKDEIFDEGRRAIIVAGHYQMLTRLEWKVLEVLRSREDRNVSKDFILQCLYPIDADCPEEGILSVVICRVRRVLEKTEYMISTSKGAGYRFERKDSMIPGIGGRKGGLARLAAASVAVLGLLGSLPAYSQSIEFKHTAGGGGGGDGTVTSVALAVPAASIFSVTGSPILTAGTLRIFTTGISGGIPYFSSTTQLSSSNLLSLNNPVLGGGAGGAPSSGSRSGNTTEFATVSGSLVDGNCLTTLSGNIIDAGVTCSGGGGSGTVTEVDTGTGLTGGPITTTGTISLDDTTVIPGSYTYTAVTVDQQGRITSISTEPPPGGDVTPGAPDGSLQYNQGGTFGGAAVANGLDMTDGLLSLSQVFNDQSTGDYTILTGDSSLILEVGAHTYTLPQAGTVGFELHWGSCLLNIGAGSATLNTTTSTFLGAGGGTSLALRPGDWACPSSDATDYPTLAAFNYLGMTADLPVIGGGAGLPLASGSRSGNTTEFVTSTGAKTTGNCVEWDASDNAVDSGAPCSGGSGTVTEVDTGTGLTGGPITTTGTVSLANTAVTPGSYTYTALTVDAQGRLTAASSGAAPTTVLGANPTATAGPVAVNGVATTYLRSDGAPAIQKATSGIFGIVEVDGVTITAAGGVISAVGAAGANPTAIAKDTAVNGVATTFLRSDGAPAVQKATAGQFGIVEVDDVTITASGGIISAVTATGANPSATAGPVAVNGAATTYMRSDGAPAVQKGTSAQFGIVEVDNTTITSVAGVISATNNGTVTSVGLSGPGGIFGITGSPVTTSGTLGLTVAGTSGGIPYFSSVSALSSSGLLAVNGFVLGGGAGAAPTTSQITGLVLGAGASAPGPYAGASCTNQFPRSQNASGAWTCATVGASDVSLANLTATDITLTFSGTYNGTTARTIGLNLGSNNAWTKGQAVTPVVLTPGTTVSVDASLSNDFTLTPAQNFTLANPTNLLAGQTLNFWITQDGTGSRVLTLGTQYQAVGGSSSIVLSTLPSTKDLLACVSDTTSSITCAVLKGISH